MFQRLFGRERHANRAITEALYGEIVAAARQKTIYSDWNVPDTPLGRFEMVSLVMFLFQNRLYGETGPSADVAQVLIDEFFTDVEHSLRELGISDVGVPKRMKKLARMFYGRTAAYADALERGDEPLATLICVHDGDLAGLFEIATDEPVRGQGHGRQLILSALKWARLRGAREAWLQVGADNGPALGLYRSLGFSDVYHYHYRRPPGAQTC